MIAAAGLLLIIIAGYSLMHVIAPDRSGLEKAGGSYLIGTGIVTVCMVLLDAVGVKITVFKLTLCLLLLTVFVLWLAKQPLIYVQRTLSGAFLRGSPAGSGLRSGNFAWYLLFLLILFLVMASAVKAVYWPPSAYDNITGYDLMAKITAAEGSFDNSLFDSDGQPMEGTAKRLIYPPMVSGSFAYAYLLGWETSRIITALFSLFFTTIFYALLRQETNYLNAVFGTFFLVITPQFYAYTSLSTTNIPFAIYVSLGLIYLYKWVRRQKPQDLWLSGLMLGFSGWTRYEGVIFGLVGLFLAGIVTYRKGSHWKRPAVYGLISLLPFLAWNIYINSHFQVSQTVVYLYPYLAIDKASTILSYLGSYVSSLDLFGLTFYALPAVVLLNIKHITKDRALYLLGITLLAICAYGLLYHQINYNQFGNLQEVMQSSFRRGLFCFVPLCWFYVFSSKQLSRTGAYLCRTLEYRS